MHFEPLFPLKPHALRKILSAVGGKSLLNKTLTSIVPVINSTVIFLIVGAVRRLLYFCKKSQ